MTAPLLPPDDPRVQHARHARRLFLWVVTGSVVFLVPWVFYLLVSLPPQYEVRQWRTAWVGFDVALVAAIAGTAYCAWRRRQVALLWAVGAATLLICDAWFDVVLDWGTPAGTGSLVSAFLGELPLAALLLNAARRLARLTALALWRQLGHREPFPPLSRLSTLALLPETWKPADQPE